MTDTTEQKIKIFISYGRTESKIFKKIVAYLESKGYEVWFDQTKIKGTDDWRESIIKGIRESQTVIAGLSEHFLRKGGVCSEEMGIALAIKSNMIYTIYLEKKEELDKIPSSLKRRQWIDLSDWEKYIENDKDFEAWFEKEFQPIIDNIESKENKEFSGQINTIRHALRIPEIGSTKADSYLIKKYTPRDNLDQKVNEWLEDKNGKKIGVVYGQPATGKSHYAAEKCHTDYHVAASFFCEYNKENFSTSKNLIRDLAFQLACQIPDYRTALLHQLESIAVPKKKINQMGLEENVDDGQIHIREDYKEAEEFEILIANPLSICIDGDMENHMILIDALDEAGKVERNKLLDIIKTHRSSLPRWLKILILTRPEPDIKSHLRGAHVINLGTEENKKDIKTYLEKIFEKEIYPNKKEIIETIIEKSQGTFLYAELVAKEILEKTMDIENLDGLPTDLESYFLNWFSRIYPIEKIDEAYKEKDRKAIAMILASPSPLPVDELNNLLGWDHSQTNDFVKKIENYLSKKDDLEGNQTIEIAHKYMADWLISDKASDYQVYKEDGLSYIYKGIEELYMLDKDPDTLTRYEKIYLIDALKSQRGKKALKDFLNNKEAKDKLIEFTKEEKENYRVESATKLYEDMIDLYKDDEENILYYSSTVNYYSNILEEIGKEEKYEKILNDVIKKLEDILSRKDDMEYKEVLANSYNNLGYLYSSMQNYGEAETYCKKAIDFLENLKETLNSLDYNSNLARYYNNLGSLYQSMKKYDESEESIKKAIDLIDNLRKIRNYLGDTSDLSVFYNNLGNLYRLMKRYDESRVYHAMAVGLIEYLKENRNSLDDKSNLARSYNNLGSLYQSMKSFEEAEFYYKKELNIKENLKESSNSPSDISELAASYTKLGYFYKSTKRNEEAEIYYDKAIDLYKDLKESTSSLKYMSNLATSYNHIGSLYESMQRYDESEIYNKKAIDLFENLKKIRNSLNDWSNLAWSYNIIAHLYTFMKRYDDAELYFKKAISMLEELNKERNSFKDREDMAKSYYYLGMLYNITNRYSEAELYYKNAIDLIENLRKERNSISDMDNLADYYKFIGFLYQFMKRYEESEIFFTRLITLRESLKEDRGSLEDIEKLGISYQNLGNLYELMERYKDAEKNYIKSIEILEKLKRNKNFTYSVADSLALYYYKLGGVYYKTKRKIQAKNRFIKALSYRKICVKERRNKENLMFLANIYMNLGTVSANGKNKKSEKYYLEAKKILEYLHNESNEHEIVTELAILYKTLSQYYKFSGKFKKAKDYMKKSHELLGVDFYF